MVTKRRAKKDRARADERFRKKILAKSRSDKTRRYRGYPYEKVETGKYIVYDSHGWFLSYVWGDWQDVKEFITSLTPKGAMEYWKALGKRQENS